MTKKTFSYDVAGIMCSECSQNIKSLLEKLSEIPDSKVYVTWETEKLTVEVGEKNKQSDLEIQNEIKKALEGYDIKPVKPIWQYIVKGVTGLSVGLVLLILMGCGIAIPMFGLAIIGGFSTLLTLLLGFESYKSAVIDLFKKRKLTMDTLFTVSTLTGIGVSIASFFVPWLSMMFDVPLLIFGFKHMGTAVEQVAKRKILRGIDFRDRVPRRVKKLEHENDTDGIEVEVNTLKPGDIIVIPKRGIIPVNGRCADANSSVYQTIYRGTGATKIVKEDELQAGMRVSDHVENMKIKVIAAQKDSYLTQLDKRIDDAKRQRLSVENETKTDKFLRYFVPGIFLFTTVMGIVVGCLFPPALAIQCVITTLVSACPCALGMVIPLAVSSGMQKGRDHGVLFKDKAALQAAAEVDIVVFDLNGTLTTGVKAVDKIISLDEKITQDEILDYLYLLEKEEKNEHAVAKAIYHYAEKNRSNRNVLMDHVEFDTKKNNPGVRAKIDGECYTLGNATMMKQYGIEMSECISSDIQPATDHLIYLARGTKIIATINLADPLREDAKEVVQELLRSGKKVYVCTGSNEETAKAYVKKLENQPGQIKIIYDSIPFEEKENKQTSKTALINELKKQGKVAMVGDGGNDAPAMSECLGIAVKSDNYDEVAEDNAGMVINGPLLRPMMAGFGIARDTMRNINVSFGISVATSLTALLTLNVVLLAVGFTLNPAIGVAMMVAQACLIFAIAYYYKRKQLPELKNEPATLAPTNTMSTPAFLRKHLVSQSPQPAPTQTTEVKNNQLQPLPSLLFSLGSNNPPLNSAGVVNNNDYIFPSP